MQKKNENREITGGDRYVAALAAGLRPPAESSTEPAGDDAAETESRCKCEGCCKKQQPGRSLDAMDLMNSEIKRRCKP